MAVEAVQGELSSDFNSIEQPSTGIQGVKINEVPALEFPRVDKTEKFDVPDLVFPPIVDDDINLPMPKSNLVEEENNSDKVSGFFSKLFGKVK